MLHSKGEGHRRFTSEFEGFRRLPDPSEYEGLRWLPREGEDFIRLTRKSEGPRLFPIEGKGFIQLPSEGFSEGWLVCRRGSDSFILRVSRHGICQKVYTCKALKCVNLNERKIATTQRK